LLPKLSELHRSKWRNCEPIECLLRAHLHAPAQEIAAEAAGCRLGWANADNAPRLAVAERAESERAGRIDLAPGLDSVAAEVLALEIAAGDAIADGKIRAAAAHGEAGQEIGGELIVKPGCKPTGVVREGGAADAGFAREFRSAIKASEPRPPARLQHRWLLGEERLEGWMIGFGLFRWGV
jgi:hypothetical protein